MATLKIDFKFVMPLCLCIATLISTNRAIEAQTEKEVRDWNQVWNALQSPQTLPPSLAQAGTPVREEDRVLFRFRAPSGAVKVFLAGSFNGFANNNRGAITNESFAMIPNGDGLYFKRFFVEPKIQQYKYVVLDKSGNFTWLADPQVKEQDKESNSVLDFSKLSTVTDVDAGNATPQRALQPFQTLIAAQPTTKQLLDVRVQNVWVRPDQTNALLVKLGDEATAKARLSINVVTPLGLSVYRATATVKKGTNRLPIPALNREGGFLAQVALTNAGRTLATGETVLSSVQDVADDLRYGFYATYRDTKSDYNAKAAMLAALHINAVEFYDYFPAHGNYAPRTANYNFEPFGIPLSARDVQRKIDAGHQRNILSLAYVASYAASESVYRKYPFPMTDENGVPKVFNGSIMSEAEADQQKKDKWFWMMDVSSGSPWHKYILQEFARTLDDSPNDLVSFDGFELDTYGDPADTRFYAKDSARNGDLLTDVLHDFVGDVQKITHRIKPHGLVSFNSVNEFGASKMGDVTDFAFLEIWNFYTQSLDDIVDICTRNRALTRQRVILKLYPATMRPPQKVWPAATLRRLLGATMTGAGSLMVVGEPDEKSSRMGALNTLFYPDHQPVPPANQQILQDYYRFDALMYGWTHGKNVHNTTQESPIPGCITRTYAVPDKKALVVQLLNVENERQWTMDTPAAAARKNLQVALDLPGSVAPKTVLFASPDVAALQKPVKLDFVVKGSTLHTSLPELSNYGTLILSY